MKLVEMCMFDNRFNIILLISWIFTLSTVVLWETSSHKIISSGPPLRNKFTNLL